MIYRRRHRKQQHSLTNTQWQPRPHADTLLHYKSREVAGEEKKEEREREREMEEKHVKLLDSFCQQQLSHPDRSSESFHCILTTNPTLCLEKQKGDLTEIYIGILRGCMGKPIAFIRRFYSVTMLLHTNKILFFLFLCS